MRGEERLVRARGILSLLAAGAAGVAVAVVLGSAGGGGSTAGAATPAQTVTLGSTAGNPTMNECLSMINCTYVPFSGVNLPGLQVPFDGTVTRFSVNSASGGNEVALRVLRPAGGGKFTGAGTSAAEMLPGGVATFTVSLPVKAGDILGLDNSDSALMFDTTDPNAITAFYELPALADGATLAPNHTATGDRLLLSAVVVQTTTTTTTTTTTGTGTTTTPTTRLPPALTRTGPARVSGSVASLGLSCHGGAGQSCTGSVVGTVGITASKPQNRTSKPKRITVTVARTTYSLATGTTKTLHVALNARGRTLLKRRGKLPVRLAFSGTLATAETVVFGGPARRIQVRTPADSWFHINPPCSNCYTMAQNVPIVGIPKGAHVAVSCRGGSCPFGHRSVTPHHGRINLASLLARSHLEPGVKLKVVISARRTTSETIVYTIQRGAAPLRSIS